MGLVVLEGDYRVLLPKRRKTNLLIERHVSVVPSYRLRGHVRPTCGVDVGQAPFLFFLALYNVQRPIPRTTGATVWVPGDGLSPSGSRGRLCRNCLDVTDAIRAAIWLRSGRVDQGFAVVGVEARTHRLTVSSAVPRLRTMSTFFFPFPPPMIAELLICTSRTKSNTE
jgi:hypothetical protein